MGLAAISYSRCQTATLGRVGKIACRTLNTTLRPCAIMPTRLRCHESGTRGGPDAWAKARLTLCRVERPRARLCPPYRSRFSLLTSTSPFSSSFLISLPLREGRAERRWRLDACEGTPIRPPLRAHARRLDASWAGWSGLRISNAATGSLWCATNARRAFARACSFDEASARRSWRANTGCPRRHPSATGAPHAPREGAAKKKNRRRE